MTHPSALTPDLRVVDRATLDRMHAAALAIPEKTACGCR